MFKIYFVNHFYYDHREFKYFIDAVEYVKSLSFEAAIHHSLGVVGFWSPINGFTNYMEDFQNSTICKN